MTLQENIDKYESAVRNWTVENLKADKDFMRDCRENVEFREWVLCQRPDIANEKGPKIKFLGLRHETPAGETKPAHVEPEPPESISKTGQIMKDLKAYKKKQGFI